MRRKTELVTIVLVLSVMAICDRVVRGDTVFPVSLTALYHGSLMLAFSIWILSLYKKAVNKFEKKVLIALSVPFLLRVFLNVLASNKSYPVYSSVVNNQYVDYVTWAGLAIVLILITWERYK